MTEISAYPFGTTNSGEAVTKYILKNENGTSVSIIGYGCAIQSIFVPDKNGELKDVVLGYDTLSGYEKGDAFLGAFVGRYANRIKNAEFTLHGKTYHLEKNDGNNHLHGTFSHKVFQGEIEGETLVFHHTSPAAEEGYPGNLTVEVRYSLNCDNALEIEYKATTDEDTVINLTNHSYFNLNGQDGSDILSHELTLNADKFTEGDAEILPTGKILSVENTPFDFRVKKQIGKDIFENCEQVKLCNGYDHNIILNRSAEGLQPFAEAVSEKTGIKMSCYTTQPAVQLYTGNVLDSDMVKCGKNGICYPRYGGFCLETQHYPCSPNFENFPSTVLKPGEIYNHKTVYKFSVV